MHMNAIIFTHVSLLHTYKHTITRVKLHAFFLLEFLIEM